MIWLFVVVKMRTQRTDGLVGRVRAHALLNQPNKNEKDEIHIASMEWVKM